MRLRSPLLLLLALTACRGEEAVPDGGHRAGAPGRTAEYTRHLYFLGEPRPEPVFAVFDFSVAERGEQLDRTATGWIRSGGAWAPLLRMAWKMERMREPWRLVPHGPVRLLVGDDGELAALAVTGPEEIRLIAEAPGARWLPGPGFDARVRPASLRFGRAPLAGTLLDLHLPGTAAPPRVVLAGADGLALLLPGDGDTGWLLDGPEEAQLDGLRLEAVGAAGTAGTAGTATDGAAADLPAWRVMVGDRRLGELEGIASIGEADAPPLRAVRGWLEVTGERRPVVGLVREGGG
jgi:hypothetical protein